jgi:ferric-dicitrate binding protein FerR (iron transport regulator)
MNDKQSIDNIENLLPRYCEGLTSEEENSRVEAWLNGDEANQKILKQVYFIYLASDVINVMNNVDTEEALKKVESRMSRRHVNLWEWAQRAAAVMFIPLVIAVIALFMNGRGAREVAQMIEVRTNPGMTTTVVLPDSTVVHLNSETVLRYPSFFSDGERNVELSGEAYFNVTKDKERKFIVSTPYNSDIEVYGTKFNVEAYKTDGMIRATLVEGSIGFVYDDMLNKEKLVKLEPRQGLVYKPQDGTVSVYKTDCETETAWKDGKIIFNNMAMGDILHMLSRKYNVKFIVKNAEINNYAFTGAFTAHRLDRVLEYFRKSSNIKWRYIDSGDIENEQQRIEIY